MISHAPTMPQDPCHAKSSTNLLQLNNRIVLAHIADSKRHDPDDSNIVHGLTFNQFTYSREERSTHYLRKLNFASHIKKGGVWQDSSGHVEEVLLNHQMLRR